MRRPLVTANWKMHGTRELCRTLLGALLERVRPKRAEVVVCPPFPYLDLSSQRIAGSKLGLGAQDLHFMHEGAYTGEVSAPMLRDCGCEWVIVGHSERRQYHRETDEVVTRKTAAALESELVPIVCVGESEQQRLEGNALSVVRGQLEALCSGLALNDLSRIVVAYEPVWAIGTGKTASPEQAQQMHEFIRGYVAEKDRALAQNMRILYGGSVKAENAAHLFAQPDIDGALVGGASLVAEQFAAICDAAEVS